MPRGVQDAGYRYTKHKCSPTFAVLRVKMDSGEEQVSKHHRIGGITEWCRKCNFSTGPNRTLIDSEHEHDIWETRIPCISKTFRNEAQMH